MPLSIIRSILQPKLQLEMMYNAYKMLIDFNVEIHLKMKNKNNVRKKLT
jgi:hypothetical protein